MAAANSVGGDGCARHERERETEEGESSGESEGRSGRRVASSGASLGRPRRKQEVARGGKQEVAEAASASATPRLCSSSWQRRKRTKEEEVGWAGPAGGAGPATGKWPRWAAGNVSLSLL